MDTALLPLPTCTRIAIIGTGDVGLSLALSFSQYYTTVGFDTCQDTITQLQQQYPKQFLKFSTNPLHIASCTVYIIAVPTPVDANQQSDLSQAITASAHIGKHLKVGDVVIYESTGYPGGTEEHCIPALEKTSGLTCNRQFSVGCSPRRLQEGDNPEHSPNLCKITSGSNTWCAQWIDDLYRKISTSGTFKAPSIAVAEAAKLLETTQYDINTALMNEWAQLCEHWHLDTRQVLDAVRSNVSFLPFTPGIISGYCSNTDPYHLIHQAQKHGYHPQLVTASRRINETMGYYLADRLVKLMVQKDITPNGARALILGFSLTENCADIRHTQVTNLIDGLRQWHISVDLYDPCVDQQRARTLLGQSVLEDYPTQNAQYHLVIIAVAHDDFRLLDCTYFNSITTENRILFDVPALYPVSWMDGRL